MSEFPRDELSREAALEQQLEECRKAVKEWELALSILVHEDLNSKTLDWFSFLVYHKRLLSGILSIADQMSNSYR